MYCVRKVNEDYTWIGAASRRLAVFEGVFGVPEGVSYNSYLMLDEKTVLFDTVDALSLIHIYLNRRKSETYRNEIKSYIVRTGMTMTEVVDYLSDEYG